MTAARQDQSGRGGDDERPETRVRDAARLECPAEWTALAARPLAALLPDRFTLAGPAA
ncbi:hypothetical protein ACFYZ9_39980 [Streptomyces sp. NPDC001691]|uniref:hypothetical protein n=1 Tax=Streptomyces sp. NPDC001691 TaxID=3364600 RepID=UPI0036C03299